MIETDHLQAINDFKKSAALVLEKAEEFIADINSSPFDLADAELALDEVKEAIEDCLKQLSVVKLY